MAPGRGKSRMKTTMLGWSGRWPRSMAKLAALFLAVPGCTTLDTVEDDPLVGRIVRTADVHTISLEELLTEMDGAQVIYLGEKHDNPRHHELQLEVLRARVARGRKPAIGFEVVSTVQTSMIMAYVQAGQSEHPHSSPEARLREALGWDDARAQSWAFYGPLLQLAREHGLTVFGAD